MKNILRNSILLFLLVLAVVLVPKTFAVITTTTGTIEISGIKEDASKVNIYKIINVNFDATSTPQQAKEPFFTWDANLGEWLLNNTSYSKYVKRTGESGSYVYEVTDEYNKDTLNNSKAIAKLYEDVEKAMGNGSLSLTAIYTNNNVGKGSLSVSKDKDNKAIGMGSYLILIKHGEESGEYTYRPSISNIIPVYDDANNTYNMTDGKAVAKSTTPQIDKKVNNSNAATAAIGTDVKFTLNVDVPRFPEDNINKSITISDTFKVAAGKTTPGLTFKKNDITVVPRINGTDQTALERDTDFNITETDYGFVITISNNQYKDLYDNNIDELFITYHGTVNENAVVTDGNINDAKLEYTNDQGTYSDSDSVKVYTYGLNIYKKDGKTKRLLPNAIFNLKKGNTVLKFTCIAGGTTCNGHYRLDSNGSADVQVDADGTLVIEGLDLGNDYSLIETVAPDGYMKLQSPLPITLADSNNDGKLNSDTDGFFEITVDNYEGFELPVTGGIGTLLFSVLGILFMGASLYLVKSIFKGKKVENN